MKITGVICEYNPFHNGHAKQLSLMKAEGAAVCLMSGNYVQRGEPAICDKLLRAEAAVRCGADLVLELPVTYALRSAEGFADGGVEIFQRLGCIDVLSFGSESAEAARLMTTAEALLQDSFSEKLKLKLELGLSFPAARQAALEDMGEDGEILTKPNDILGVEYCKALIRRNSSIEPMVIRRDGNYHTGQSVEAPSASILRGKDNWHGYMPEEALKVQTSAPRHSLKAGERAILARLRSMSDEEFEALPFGSEGLWRKIMLACRTQRDVNDIITAAKSKRYTQTRLMRMLMCAFLGIDEKLLYAEAPYVRVLSLNEQGGRILRQMREEGHIQLLNIGEKAPDGRYSALERRSQALYGLFSESQAEPAHRAEKLQFCSEFC